MCCQELEKHIATNDISYKKDGQICIRGRIGTIDIFFCPFCGKNIEKIMTLNPQPMGNGIPWD